MKEQEPGTFHHVRANGFKGERHRFHSDILSCHAAYHRSVFYQNNLFYDGVRPIKLVSAVIYDMLNGLGAIGDVENDAAALFLCFFQGVGHGVLSAPMQSLQLPCVTIDVVIRGFSALPVYGFTENDIVPLSGKVSGDVPLIVFRHCPVFCPIPVIMPARLTAVAKHTSLPVVRRDRVVLRGRF